MKQVLFEYENFQGVMNLYCDNMSTLNISKQLVQQSKTKYIDIWYHFILELIENEITLGYLVILMKPLHFIQLYDILTKPLHIATFESIWDGLGVFRLTQ